MDNSTTFFLVLGSIFLAWAICVLLFSGDTYMKWYYLANYQKYDKRKFKAVHVASLALIGLGSFLFAFVETASQNKWLAIFFAILILHYILLFTFCKK